MFDDKVPDIKRTIGTPAKTQETFTCNRVDEAVVCEKGRELGHDFRKVGCVVDLFLNTWGLDGWMTVIELEELT